MNIRKKIFLLFLFSLIGFLVGYILTNSIKFDICNVTKLITEAGCINFYERLGDPLFYGMQALALIFFILIFIPRAFSFWKKFAIYFIPIATLIFIFYDNPSSGDYFSPYPEQLFQYISIIYVIISLIIILKVKFTKQNNTN